MDHKIDHKYPKLLKIPLLNTEHKHSPHSKEDHHRQAAVTGCNKFEVSNSSWTTDGTASTSKPTEFQCLPPESCLQPEHSNTKHSIVLEDAHILQDAKDRLASLLEGEFNNIISKSPIGVGRRNLFQMDIPTAGLLVACKPYPIP